MNFIRLVHHKKLKYPAKKQWIPIPRADWERFAGTHDVLLSFRPVEGVRPAREMEQVAAYTRYLDIASQDVQHIVCYELEESSIFYPLVLWDLAHTLPVGGTITIVGENTWLCRDYYHGAMELIEEADGVAIWQKLRPLLIEQDAGLDAWTFGIPTGPGDAEGLNAIIERILELDIPQKEILLCGRPGDNFRYWDQVRIVGEDIPYPPVRICAKKNRLAQEAKYPNLCIMHDRVYLPKDFGKAVRRFGDFFGVSGFQSLYFGDRWNCSFTRYSDYDKCNILDFSCMSSSGEYRRIKHEWRDVVCSSLESYYANALRVSEQNYFTGSLYLVKKSLWEKYQQDENLYWEDYEDVEYGQRLWKLGIPSIVNPYSLTQSLYGRSTIMSGGSVYYEKAEGKHQRKSYYMTLLHGKGKPSMKVTLQSYRKKYINFCRRYHCGNITHIPAKKSCSAYDFFNAVFSAVYLARVPAEPEAIRKFISWIEKDLLGVTFIPPDVTFWTKQFCEHAEKAKKQFLRWNYWTSLYAIYHAREMFMLSIQDFFVPDTLFVRMGTLWSALRLWRQNGEMFFHRDGFRGYVHSIWNSTPFVSGGTRR